MTDISRYLIENAYRRYIAPRRMFWRFFIGGMFVLVCTAALDPFLNIPEDSEIRQVIEFCLNIAFLACATRAFVASCISQRFRCPRCGNKFVPSFESTWTFSDPQCIHCGLRLEQQPQGTGDVIWHDSERLRHRMASRKAIEQAMSVAQDHGIRPHIRNVRKNEYL